MFTGFDARAYLPRETHDAITDVRIRQPGFADGEADRRTRRRVAVPDGKLVILAADHPGRASLKIQDDPVAMAVTRTTIGPPLHYMLLMTGLSRSDAVEAQLDVVIPWLERRLALLGEPVAGLEHGVGGGPRAVVAGDDVAPRLQRLGLGHGVEGATLVALEVDEHPRLEARAEA